jgi:hypothetical protein
MSTAATSKITKPRKGERIAPGTLSYLRARTRLRIHSMLLETFDRAGIKQAELARMLDKKPEVVNRVLGEPGNYRLDTLTDFLFAMAGAELSDVPQLIEQKADAGPPPWLKRNLDDFAPGTDSEDDATIIELARA